MPELPDVEVYVEAVRRRALGAELRELRLGNPFLLRTVDPAPSAFHGGRLEGVSRLGKRVVLSFAGDLHAALHLMIAGRLHWQAARKKLAGRSALASFDFDAGSLSLTEAGTKRRSAIHLVRGRAKLAALDRGGIEPLTATREEFRAALSRENHTLKRALTDPRLVAGIGNAYSDEILHAARLSPTSWTSRLDDAAWERLFAATRTTLETWIRRLSQQCGEDFPERVTAFHPEMAVHGKFKEPCPECGAKVQRIVGAERESNYCPRCQTGGRLLADRALSKLLKADWPRTIDDDEKGADAAPAQSPMHRRKRS